MKKYDQYTLEDFVQDFYFRKWVHGNLHPLDKSWETWLDSNPEKMLLVEEARSMVIGLAYLPEKESRDDEVMLAISRIKTALHKPPFYKRKWFLYAAALFPVVAVAGLLMINDLEKSNTTSSLYQTGTQLNWRTNDTENFTDITLEDGSLVRLAPKSRLGITGQFDRENRSVWLEGEAMFDVVKKADQPFIVHSHNVVTKVLGTVFKVKAYEDQENISVSVSSGKVTVQKQTSGEEDNSDSSSEMILTPNQQAVISRTNDRFVKTLVEAPVVIAPANSNLQYNFNDTPISEVFASLEHAYGIQIAYDKERLLKCNLTAQLREEDLFQKLDMICETIQAAYRITDGQILIEGIGCD